jgi:hypothetical protein
MFPQEVRGGNGTGGLETHWSLNHRRTGVLYTESQPEWQRVVDLTSIWLYLRRCESEIRNWGRWVTFFKKLDWDTDALLKYGQSTEMYTCVYMYTSTETCIHVHCTGQFSVFSLTGPSRSNFLFLNGREPLYSKLRNSSLGFLMWKLLNGGELPS